tara:strand:- start:102 stop:413 length:312 start_codon:yes stop_codon:yes gene_type:complete
MTDTRKIISIELDGTVVERIVKKGDPDYRESTGPTEEWLAEDRGKQERTKRGHLLADTDWTQNPDVPSDTKTKWQSYRQALRDISTHSNWPDLEDSDWPTKPT